ncbi:hypothetical protein NC652_041795 [Populus alba x Populus x berolinensis]|nr:hypothetical protein NC652_041795 [Populus alba x Populus x berolinensis]
MEWKGKSFPFSKGCSFYRLDAVNGKRQIIYIPHMSPESLPGLNPAQQLSLESYQHALTVFSDR